MSKGKLKERDFAFWKDDVGFIKGFGAYTLKASEATIYKNTSEVRKAMKSFAGWKDLEGIKVVEFPIIKERTRSPNKPKPKAE